MGKDPFDLDAHYSFYRAGPIHLYYAEALNASGRFRDAEDVLNRGISFGTSSVSGVRRRAYLAHTERINTDPYQNLEEGLVILDVRELTSVADVFIICTGRSNRQVTAIADFIQSDLKKHGINKKDID